MVISLGLGQPKKPNNLDSSLKYPRNENTMPSLQTRKVKRGLQGRRQVTWLMRDSACDPICWKCCASPRKWGRSHREGGNKKERHVFILAKF